jgi:putative peptidoglycan lipid II flippase
MKKSKSILHATVAVSLMAIIGKALGFIRAAIIAAFYGATAETDAFFFAQGMPNMIFPAVGYSLGMTFTFLYVKRITNDEAEGDKYASRMISSGLGLGVVLGIAGALISPILVPLLAPGFSTEQSSLAIMLTRITMSAFVLIVLQYLIGAIMNSKKIFVGTQIAALFYDITVIVLTVLLGKTANVIVLTWINVIGIFLHIVALIICGRGSFKYTFYLNPFQSEFKELVRMAIPILLGNSVVQINNIVDKYLSSSLPNGTLSALSYANTLQQFVFSVFVASLSTVLYPTLTGYMVKGDYSKYASSLMSSLKTMAFLLIPVSSITVIEASDIVSSVFGRGHFDTNAVGMTAVILACYAPSFVFVGMREVLSRGLFAMQDSKTPAINSALGVACNIVFSILFVRYMGAAGIALGTTVSSLVSSSLLLRSAKQKVSEIRLREFIVPFIKQAISGIILCLTYLGIRKIIPITNALFRFGIMTVIGFGIYLLVLFVIDKNQTVDFFKLIKSILRRNKT